MYCWTMGVEGVLFWIRCGFGCSFRWVLIVGLLVGLVFFGDVLMGALEVVYDCGSLVWYVLTVSWRLSLIHA